MTKTLKKKTIKLSKKKNKNTKKTSVNKDNNSKNNNYLEALLQNVNSSQKEIYKALIDFEKKKENSQFYPSINDKDFSSKIYNSKKFNIYKIPSKINQAEELVKSYEKNENMKIKKNPYKTFEISPSQNFLRNFMSPYSPYRSILIIHGTGVGKTCTGITIAEGLKEMVSQNNKKIYIVRDKEFQRQLFEMNKVKQGIEDIQCTGLEYINKIDKNLLEKCQTTKESVDCDNLKTKVKRVLNKYYIFEGLEKWARTIYNAINNSSSNLTPQQLHNKKIKYIRDNFSNNVLIIDEAHHINSINNESTLIAKILNDVLLYSQNLRLILLTATPMFDKPEDIKSLINYMLLNDKRAPIEKKIFDQEGNFIEETSKLLIDKTRGYISYLRGNDPFKFPLRLSAKVNIPNSILNLKKYPAIPKHFSHIKHKMKFLELIDCKMSKQQLEVYEEILKSDNTYAWTNESQITNFIYNTLKDSKDNISICFGSQGFNNIIIPKKSKKDAYKFKDEEYGKRFLGDELKKYSAKIHKIMEIIKKSTTVGPVFIFTSFIHSGVIPLILSLEMNGFKPYKTHGNPYLKNKYKSSEYLGDYIVLSGNPDEITISQSSIKSYLDKGSSMINENIKVFIGTESASEGLNLFGYREVHILEPHFNLSRLEQAIGRTIRTGSHNHLPPSQKNVTVYMYAATGDKVETVDLYKYRNSEMKAISTGKVEKLLKENSVDCHLNKEGNIYDERHFNKLVNIETSLNKKIKYSLKDMPFSRICHYMDSCDYKCLSNLKKSNIDESNFITRDIEKKINQFEIEIIKLVKDELIVNVKDLFSLLNIPKTDENILALKIALEKINDSNELFVNKQNVKGKINIFGLYIKFIPSNFAYNKLNKLLINKKYEFYNKEIDMKNYINMLEKDKKKLVENIKYDYDKTIKNLYSKVNNIINKTIFQSYKFNIDISEKEVISMVADKIPLQEKTEIIKVLIYKINNNESLNQFEIKLLDVYKSNFVSYDDILNNKNDEYYGFLIGSSRGLIFYSFNEKKKKFEKDNGMMNKIIKIKKKKLENTKVNNLHGLLMNKNNNNEPEFKIKDILSDDKKSITGSVCFPKSKNEIFNYINLLDPKYEIKNKQKNVICNDLELLFRKKDNKRENNSRWFLNVEENLVLSY